MQRQLIFQIGKEAITLGVAPYFFDTIEGLASSETDPILHTRTNYDGSIFGGANLTERNIVITGRIRGNTREEAFTYRRKLISIFNAKRGLGKLTVRYTNGEEYYIEAFVNGGVDITEQNISVIAGNVFEYQITLTCPNPYWKQEETYEMIFSQVLPKFQFDFSIEATDEHSMIFGEVYFNQKITINNKGDCPTGFTCIVDGKITDYFILHNVDTGEYIKIERDFTNVQKLVIESHLGKKTITAYMKDGSIEKGFRYMDFESVFFNLEAGDNEVMFETNSADVDLSVRIIHENLYAGV